MKDKHWDTQSVKQAINKANDEPITEIEKINIPINPITSSKPWVADAVEGKINELVEEINKLKRGE